jgi:hypothetical protein
VLDEYWVTFDVFPNYAVSSYGRVLNVVRDRDLTPSPDASGHLRVALYVNGTPHYVYVHRLVAKAFFQNYAPDVEVLHKNGDFNDNSVLNLTLGERCRSGGELLW